MALHTYVAGEVLTASNLNASVNPKVAFKTATETVNNNNTLQDDDQLFITPATNSTYLVQCMVIYQTSTSVPDFQLRWTFPAGASFNWVPMGLSPTDTDQNTGQQAGYLRMGSTSSSTSRTIGANSNENIATPMGLLIMGATAGNLQLQWAQAVATAENTQVKANSFIVATKVA